MRGYWTEIKRSDDESMPSPSIACRNQFNAGLDPYRSSRDHSNSSSPARRSRSSSVRSELGEGVVEKVVFGANPGQCQLVVKGTRGAGQNNYVGYSSLEYDDSPDGSMCSLLSEDPDDAPAKHSFKASRTRDSIQVTMDHVHKFGKPLMKPPRISITTEEDGEGSENEQSPHITTHRDSLEKIHEAASDHKIPPCQPPDKKPVRIPVITEEMLEKHSLHHLLINNFFMSASDSSSIESLSPAPTPRATKRVQFNMVPTEIKETPRPKYAFIEAGSVFQTHWDTLSRHEHTLLGSQEKWIYFDSEKQRFVFEVIKWIKTDPELFPDMPDEPVYIKPECFESILYYYQDSKSILRCPKGVRNETFLDTLKFFKINPREITIGAYETEPKDDFEGLVPNEPDTIQTKIFLFLYHKESTVTKIYTALDVLFILTSVMSCITATLEFNRPPHLAHDDDEHFFERFGALEIFVQIDGVCMIWFFIMFFLHFIAAPKKMDFFRSVQNGVDMLLIATYCLLLAIGHSEVPYRMGIQNFIRLTFSFRILRVSRHSLLLNSLGTALKEALRELISIIMFLFVIVFLFACMEYLAEVTEPEPSNITSVCLDGICGEGEGEGEGDGDGDGGHGHEEHHEVNAHFSILEYVWWSLITITTVGYGTPEIYTTAGKVVGGMCAIAGVPLFAIPIPILSKHLERVYQRELRKNEFMKERMVWLTTGWKGPQENDNSDSDGSEEEDEEAWNWKKIVGERRKSMGPQFAMTHFRP